MAVSDLGACSQRRTGRGDLVPLPTTRPYAVGERAPWANVAVA
ncbi:hypothetical protein [Terrabacter terrigena]|uniref:Uncharacterized protein n=1 Tax=Terrabacter terrigena TaxID=574718 RepID=A0ABW3N184_9MICO